MRKHFESLGEHREVIDENPPITTPGLLIPGQETALTRMQDTPERVMARATEFNIINTLNTLINITKTRNDLRGYYASILRTIDSGKFKLNETNNNVWRP